jgi:hypothetical protein
MMEGLIHTHHGEGADLLAGMELARTFEATMDTKGTG